MTDPTAPTALAGSPTAPPTAATPLPQRRTFRLLVREAMQERRQLTDLQDQEWRVQETREVLECATTEAERALGAEAAGMLEWNVNLDPGPDVSEATAELPIAYNVHRARLRWRHVVDNAEESGLQLVRACGSCGTERVDPVTSLAQLGELMSQWVSW